jgi:hypothetical protein
MGGEESTGFEGTAGSGFGEFEANDRSAGSDRFAIPQSNQQQQFMVNPGSNASS